MKRLILVALVALVAGVGAAHADMQSASVTVTNTQTAISASIPASGWLDRIEITVTGSSTSAVTVASYAADGTTAVDTFLTLATATANTVVRPRVIGTTTAGVNLAAASTLVTVNESLETNAVPTQVLIAQYDRIMIGGDIRLKVVAGSAAANTVTAKIFYEPTNK
jgi:hypothetical protein